MVSIKRLLEIPVASDGAYSKFASLASYVLAMAILVLGVKRFSSYALTEIELVLATISVVTLSLLCVIFGQLLEINRRLHAIQSERQGTDATERL